MVLDYTSDSGYSDWTQLADGTLLYTRTESAPVLKAYRVGKEELE